MLNKLKDDILRLLKEDEEFRYAVIGLLGLQRLEEAITRLIDTQADMGARLSDAVTSIESRLSKVEEAIARLIDSHTELRNIVSRLIDTQASMESRLSKVEEAVVMLSNAMTRLSDAVARLIDAQASMEARLSKLEDAVARLTHIQTSMESRLSKVEDVVSRLADIQARQEERLTKVEERLTRVEERLEEHDRKFNEIMEELKDLRRISNEHTRILDEHTRLLAELRVSIGSMGRRLGKDMERMVLNIYKDQLMHIGIDPDKVKRFEYIDEEGKYGRKGKEYEFDIIVSNEHTDVLEVKAHTQRGDVEWFHDNVESIKTLFEKPLRRKVIVTVHVDEDALYRADILGINVIYGNIVKD